MSVDSPEASAAPARTVAVALLVAGAGLVLVAVALRAAGGLDLADAGTTPGDLVEHGRLAGARSTVAFVAGAGLVWIGYWELGAPRGHGLARRALVLSLGVLAVGVLQGLWVVVAVSALTATVCGARSRTPRVDGRVTPLL
ncbi:hypothetical protein DDP54_09185 [Cellulomonas sp. WB94]|uniref:hypothetical protein n=1 Tax=Cellulomonas sp. WB94 TaxID=2173174 RepID=UPI000D570CBD|nr:hypothetical protein [Cellulomonas sp. WB94]PVU83144.1 hypothetical protein DDP54_09185 [Cellulomonas sp. WB94]